VRVDITSVDFAGRRTPCDIAHHCSHSRTYTALRREHGAFLLALLNVPWQLPTAPDDTYESTRTSVAHRRVSLLAFKQVRKAARACVCVYVDVVAQLDVFAALEFGLICVWAAKEHLHDIVEHMAAHE
jgi:hypothetical protein